MPVALICYREYTCFLRQCNLFCQYACGAEPIPAEWNRAAAHGGPCVDNVERVQSPAMTSVRLEHIGKQFGTTVALEDVSLQIAAGELFFLLGPSGCGKSTLLRLIAGLHEPTGGRIFFNDRDVTDLPHRAAQRRDVFPELRPLAAHERARERALRAERARPGQPPSRSSASTRCCKLVQMDDLADRKPNQLSGGQQQRVALARALAVQPDCLLLDEPLSNLDAKLRQEMRSEIRRICKTAGFTTIYVTHDQKEALCVADRIAVLKDGRLMQVGTPGELYHQPAQQLRRRLHRPDQPAAAAR